MASVDLNKAFQNFADNMSDVAASMAINNANEQVQNARANIDDETEQRKALAGISSNLVSNLSKIGRTDAKTIKNLSEQISPKQKFFQTAEQALVHGIMINSDLSAQQKQDRLRTLVETKKSTVGERSLKLRGDQFAFKKEQVEVGKTVKGFGLATTKQDATKFKEVLKVTNSSLADLGKLIQMARDPTGKLSLIKRRRAQTLAGTLFGKMRLAVIGPGAVSDIERAILAKIISDPTKLTELPSQSISALTTLQENLAQNAIEHGLASGIDEKALENRFRPFIKRAGLVQEKMDTLQVDFSGDIFRQIKQRDEALIQTLDGQPDEEGPSVRQPRTAPAGSLLPGIEEGF